MLHLFGWEPSPFPSKFTRKFTQVSVGCHSVSFTHFQVILVLCCEHRLSSEPDSKSQSSLGPCVPHLACFQGGLQGAWQPVQNTRSGLWHSTVECWRSRHEENLQQNRPKSLSSGRRGLSKDETPPPKKNIQNSARIKKKKKSRAKCWKEEVGASCAAM